MALNFCSGAGCAFLMILISIYRTCIVLPRAQVYGTMHESIDIVKGWKMAFVVPHLSVILIRIIKAISNGIEMVASRFQVWLV